MNILSLFDGMSCGQIALERAGIEVENYFSSEIDKHAVKVTQSNYPDTIQLGDVRNVKYEDGILWGDNGRYEVDIDLLIGGSPCFVAGTKIIKDDELINIEDLQIGDKVLTHTGHYKSVLNIGSQKSSIYKMLAQSSTYTLTTANHPYYIRKRYKKWNNEKRTYEFHFENPKWLPVREINKGDFLATPILTTNKNPANLTESECFIIGLYIGDGHTRKDYRKSENRSNHRHWQLIISVGSHEKDLFEQFVNVKHSLYKHTTNTYRAVFSNKRLVNYVEKNCGIGAINKQFSKAILDLPINLLEKVIEGYLFADGSYRKETYRATSVSKQLVETLSLAVAKVYKTTTSIIFTKRPPKGIIEGRTVNQKDTWTIQFKKEHPKGSNAWVIDGFIWNPVKEIIDLAYKDLAYNIEVEDDNSYISNNHVVHNCQGFSFAGKGLDFDDPRSKLFFEFVRLKDEIEPKFFMLENVRMKKEHENIISRYLGVIPKLINSNLVSAQNRNRLYWCNWDIDEIEDKGILLKDIVHEKNNEDFDLDEFVRTSQYTFTLLDKETDRGKIGFFGYDAQGSAVYIIHNKSISLASSGGLTMGAYLFGVLRADKNGYCGNGQRLNNGRKSHTLTASDKHGVMLDGYIRKLTPVEYERLQTVPDNYTNSVSKTQRYKMLGNGWTVNVIVELFKSMVKNGVSKDKEYFYQKQLIS